MTTGPNRYGQGSSILEQIREGMEVYDVNNEHVGEVEDLFFGGVSEQAESRGAGAVSDTGFHEQGDTGGTDNIFQAFAEALGGEPDMDETMADRLRHNGFIRIDTGIISRDCFAMPDQIASVSGERVQLKVAASELMRR